ncbi:MAG TPA: HAD family hydrolase [Thermaerobacter sp.]
MGGKTPGPEAVPTVEGEDAQVRAVLFDLDGTLLELDMARFLPVYLQRLASYVADLFEPEDFVRQLMRATAAVIGNRDRSRTNERVLYDTFWSGLDPARHPGARPERREEAMARFDRFYRTEFGRLRHMARPRPEAPRVVAAARARGCKVVLATSPVFPRVAIEERLRWAGLDAGQFDLVTTLENVHTCKPQPDYYDEVAARVGVEPAQCLMVGNDLRDDIAPAALAGMGVYVVEGLIVNEGEADAPRAPRGSLRQLLEWLEGPAPLGNIFANTPTLHGNSGNLQ